MNDLNGNEMIFFIFERDEEERVKMRIQRIEKRTTILIVT